MQRLINQIYWSSDDFFSYGTKLKMTKKQRIQVHNALMAPGRAIIRWESSLNYQGDKAVPQLPILKVGEEYRMVAHLSTKPADSYLIRIIFRDIQGTEVKRIDFRSLQRKFVFPNDAVTYSIQIINSGFYDLQFDRIEIGPVNLPTDAYGNIWVQKQLNKVTPDKPLNIILVDDGKQARRTHPELNDFYTHLPLQLISVSWQFDGNLRKWLLKWLRSKHLLQFHLISTSPRFDDVVVDIAQKFPLSDVMITKPINGNMIDYHTWKRVEPAWANGNISNVDWQNVISEMKNVWEGGLL